MPHGLVDLHDHLVRVQDQGGHLAGAVLCGKQVDGLPPRSLRLIDQADRADVLVSCCPKVASKGVRERAPLDFTLSDGGGFDAAPRMDDGLFDGCALARGEM